MKEGQRTGEKAFFPLLCALLDKSLSHKLRCGDPAEAPKRPAGKRCRQGTAAHDPPESMRKRCHTVDTRTESVEATLQSLFLLLGVHSNSDASQAVLPYGEAHSLEMMGEDLLKLAC